MPHRINAAVLLLTKNQELSCMGLGISEETLLANTEFRFLPASKQTKPPFLQGQLWKLKMLSKVLSKVLCDLAGCAANSLCMEHIVTFLTRQGEGIVL